MEIFTLFNLNRINRWMEPRFRITNNVDRDLLITVYMSDCAKQYALYNLGFTSLHPLYDRQLIYAGPLAKGDTIDFDESDNVRFDIFYPDPSNSDCYLRVINSMTAHSFANFNFRTVDKETSEEPFCFESKI